jgi:hypothetical protein
MPNPFPRVVPKRPPVKASVRAAIRGPLKSPQAPRGPELIMTLSTFATHLRATKDEVYLSLLRQNHVGGRTFSQWMALIDGYRRQPAYSRG